LKPGLKKVLDPESKTLCYICNSRDITEHIESEDRLIMAMEMASAASRAKSEFLANISHEIRTPMNAILGFTQLMDSMIDNEELSGYLTAINSAGNSLLTLINDILDLSKIEAGKIELLYEPVRLKNLFEEIENIFSLKVKEKKIRYVIDLDRELPPLIILDKARIRQVLFNIVGNAIKFTEKGFIKISAGARSRSDESGLVDIIISVEDSGVGIPEEEQGRIFESFVQRRGQNKTMYGGTGLGLSICKKLLDAMGGEISVVSTPGRGSMFTMTIRDVRVGDAKTSSNDIDYSSISFTRATILAVTDDKTDLNLINEVFSGTEVEIASCKSPDSAGDIIESLNPDLIIIDSRMVINKPVSQKILTQEGRDKRIPLIFISPEGPEMEKIELLPEYRDFDGSIHKPFSKSSIYWEVGRFIGFRDLPVNAGVVSENIYFHELKKSGFQGDSLELIPTMVHILEDEYMPLWEKYRSVQQMNKLKEFGTGIADIGVQYSVEQLADYGGDLVKYADRFDVDKLRKTLEFFPEIIDTVKRLLDSR
jgi:nitrogen-specific signal transduction histidine kinase